MIEIKGVCKSFSDHEIFNHLNLEIENGEFVIFSGVSGCGKTTLLNMIGGLEPVDSGTILVDGIDISKRKNKLDYFSKKISFLFQNFALIEDKTVEQNLKLVRKASQSGVSIEDALKRVGLLDKLKNKVYTLSGGEQQRVALARLMIKKCDIILADEPTGSLDSQNADAVMDILRSLNAEGKTIILVTHDEKIKKQGKRVVEL